MDSFFYFFLNIIKNFPYSNNFLNSSSVKVSISVARITYSFARKGVIKMRTINKWRYLYYWTKTEKALDEGNDDKYRKYRDKFKRIQLLTIRKG